MIFVRQNLVLRVSIISFNSSLFKRYNTKIAAQMPKIPEINPCKNTP